MFDSLYGYTEEDAIKALDHELIKQKGMTWYNLVKEEQNQLLEEYKAGGSAKDVVFKVARYW